VASVTPRRAASVLLAALVVLAGCGASPGDDATPTNGTTVSGTTPTASTTTPPASVEVREGTLPVNATRVFERVRSVLGSDVGPPASVVVGNDSARTAAGTVPVRPFWRTVGVTVESPTGPEPLAESGYTTGLGTVVVTPGDESNASSVRTVLAHEYVHYVQVASGDAERLRGDLPETTDGRFVARAVLEGVAVATTDAYLDRYRPETRPNEALYDRIAVTYPAGSAQRYANLQYLAGTDYATARLDTPADHTELYERPPRTGEQVLHGLAPGTEPPRALSVTLTTDSYTEVGRDTLGEPFVRTVLAGAVDAETATRAATGWGNDTLVTVRDGDAVGYAWTLRWDDAANASEARNALAVTLASLSGDSRLTVVDDETLVVLIGDERFVEEATVSGENGDVSVDAP